MGPPKCKWTLTAGSACFKTTSFVTHDNNREHDTASHNILDINWNQTQDGLYGLREHVNSEIKSIYFCVLGEQSKLNCKKKIAKQMNREGHGLGRGKCPGS